jgi:antirestriction protein
MTVESLDLRDLATELEDLRGRAQDPDDTLDEDELERLVDLVALEDEIGDLNLYSDHSGPEMIREDTFVEYAKELADDMGAVPAEFSWPASYIDWEAAARDLAMDYSLVRFDGRDWYVRS